LAAVDLLRQVIFLLHIPRLPFLYRFNQADGFRLFDMVVQSARFFVQFLGDRFIVFGRNGWNGEFLFFTHPIRLWRSPVFVRIGL
jgi:hypothetical protein